MRRPRHREKSNLFWKMVGVAALVNVFLWPVLVRLGLFNGIRQEVLIPVGLIDAPPSHKLPDTLQKTIRVAKVGTPLRPAAPRPPLTHPLRQTKAIPPPVTPPVPKKVPQARLPQSGGTFVMMHPVPTPQLAHHKSPQPSSHAAIVSKIPSHKAVSRPDANRVFRLARNWHEVQAEVAVRRARAAVLEEKGHEVAEWIAQQRALNSNPGAAQTFPAAVITKPTGTVPESMSTNHPVEVLSQPVQDKIAPAVMVSQLSPTIPARLQRSSWRARFQGRLTINSDGSVHVEMISSTGVPALDKRALEAARHWKFRPATDNGVPVTSSRGFVIDYAVRSVP